MRRRLMCADPSPLMSANSSLDGAARRGSRDGCLTSARLISADISPLDERRSPDAQEGTTDQPELPTTTFQFT
eukprot:12656073-Alexandrium_andersonii.AAC.1